MEGKEIDEFSRHIILYAKGYYEKKNIVEDLKKIVSIFTDLTRNIKNVSVKRTYEHLSCVYFLALEFELDKKEQRNRNFVADVFKDNTIESRGEKDYLTVEFMMRRMLTFIERVKFEGVDLGKPDPNILPIRLRR